MSKVNFTRTYPLGAGYAGVRERARGELGRYWHYENLVWFDERERCVTFTSERLIPAVSKGRPRVMLLFSNPHPHSIRQGMFLSPNTRGAENPFWPVMDAAGWIPIPKAERRPPAQLADRCLHLDYPGPFELVFYCYYAFPTDYPEDIKAIFGTEFFEGIIEPESAAELLETIREGAIQAVVAFNKGVFNRVAEEGVERYIDDLKKGKVIRSRVSGLARPAPVFLTYPTGWRYHKAYRDLRVASLERIREAILDW